MVSTKALAAIALTLIIVVPIGIGFLTAVHQEETESWQTTSSSKISDIMLNYQTPYYGSYKGSTNNSTLLSEDNVAPDYVTVTSTFTSLPIYTNSPTTLTTNAAETVYAGGSNTAIMPTDGAVDAGFTKVIVGVHDMYYIVGANVHLTLSDNSTQHFPIGRIALYRDSASTWTANSLNGSGTVTATYTGVTWWSAYTKYTYPEGDWVTISLTYQYADLVGFSNLSPCSVTAMDATLKINDTYQHGNFNISLNGTTLSINGADRPFDPSTEYIGVTSLQATSAITSVLSGQYADPADGWTVPTPGTTYDWLNNQVNESVTMYVKADMTAGQTARIGNLILDVYDGQTRAHLASYDGTPTVIGAYTYLQVVMSTDGYKITGLSSWPSMGQVPSTFNSVELDEAISTFYTIGIKADSQNWHFRVDNANVYSGTYPSTHDYTLNLQQIYPDTNIDVYLNSIGLYGDYINFGGAQLTVDNGSVSINGQTYRLLHAHLSAWNEGTHYSLRINGDEVATTSEPPTIFWGGEWSVTATAYKIEQVQGYITVWHAGEFGLDKTGFAVAGLIACIALFVALGMTGQRSGGKAWLLLLICGGAGIVFLLII